MSAPVICKKCGWSGAVETDAVPVLCCMCGSVLETNLHGQTGVATVPIEPTAAYTPAPSGPLPHVPGYEVREEIGRGGMGLVYRARQRSLGREVALKVLPPVLAVDPERLMRFRNEAEVAAKLNESHVLPVYDVVNVDGTPVLVMPYIEGTTLARIADAARDPANDRAYLDRALPLCDQLVEAVAVTHAAGIVHRDIKPSNVLVDTREHVWLADFGLARLGEGVGTSQGHVMGTPGYMSPEQADGAADLDARADQFSLGATLYKVLARDLPYGKKRVTPDAMPKPPSEHQPMLSADFDAVLMKALEAERERRYATTAEFREDWMRARQGLPPKARRLSKPGRMLRWASRHRWRVATAGFVVVLLGLVGAMWPRQTAQLPVDPVERRDIVITTEPAGARVVLVPFDEYGELDPARKLRPAGVTPLRVTGVATGSYLVVADIPGQGFHEVYRLVPGQEQNQGRYAHDTWRSLADGTVELPSIRLFAQSDLAEPMTLFPGGVFWMGAQLDPNGPWKKAPFNPPQQRQVDSYYLDPTEVTVAAYIKVQAILPALFQKKYTPAPPGFGAYPVTFVAFGRARDHAERVGKRLPTEAEYEYAATHAGTRSFPWGDDLDLLKQLPGKIEPVGLPAFDSLPTNPPVHGLYSNAAEWTESMATPYDPDQHPSVLRYGRNGDVFFRKFLRLRVVRGGSTALITGIEGKGLPALEVPFGTRFRSGVDVDEVYPGLGFRCARSVKPRFLEE